MAGRPIKRLKEQLRDADGLSIAERRFIDRVLIHCDINRAVREVYPNGGGRFARHLLEDKNVHRVLKRERDALTARYKLSAEWVLEELAFIIRSRNRDLYNADGSLRHPTDLPDAVDASIASIESEDIWEGRGEGRQRVGEVRKYKRYSKTEAIALAMKYLRLLEGDPAQKRNRLDELEAVFKAGPVVATPPVIEGEVKK